MNINYLVRANSSTGLENKMDSNLGGIKKIFCLESRSDYLKSEFLGRIGSFLENRGEDVQYIISPFFKDFYDGIITRNVAIIDGNCIGNKKKYDCKTVDLDKCLFQGVFYDETEDIKNSIDEKYSLIYELYAKAKTIHDEWERVYISNMNVSGLNNFCDNTLHKIFENVTAKNAKAEKYERFFGGAFSHGHIEFIDSISQGLEKRYFIKGRPGSGKSTFLKKIVAKALELGYDTEVYYCAFDVYSLDMVVIRDLSLCIFDSTSPHEKFPQKESDEILDFYTHSGLDGVDEKFEKELDDIKIRYAKLMSKAKEYMTDANSLYEKLNLFFKEKIDYEILNNLVYEMLNNLC